jgi:hypothetical protein
MDEPPHPFRMIMQTEYVLLPQSTVGQSEVSQNHSIRQSLFGT